MRIAFFTAGTIGAGHFARGAAIGRALDRAGLGRDAATYRMFGPMPAFASDVALDWRAQWTSEAIVHADLEGRDRACATSLAESLSAYAPDLLIVDMFWAPLRWVLPLADCEAWLLLRSFPSDWLAGPPGFPFDPMQYARIISIEPVASGAITHSIDPLVMVNPDELAPRGALRERLGISENARLVGVVHAGSPGELQALVPSPVADETVVTFNAFVKEALFPVARFVGDCDRIHAAAGYNTFWEARWLGWFDRTRFSPFERKIDDQRWRIERCARHRMIDNGADTLATWIRRG